MNVYKQRRNICERLRRVCSSGTIIVSTPDHPLLLRPPDLLVGGDGRLLAIMCGTIAEARRPQQALARFALCRAALPPETLFAFVTRPNTVKIAETLAREVHAVVEWKNIPDLLKINIGSKDSEKQKTQKEERLYAMKKFGSSYRVAQSLNDRPEPGRTKSSIRDTLRPNYLSQTTPYVDDKNLPKNVAQLTLQGARDFFSLDDGIAYVSRGPSGVVYTDMAPSYQGDPAKFLRASAFSGWVLVPTLLEKDRARVEDMIIRFTALG